MSSTFLNVGFESWTKARSQHISITMMESDAVLADCVYSKEPKTLEVATVDHKFSLQCEGVLREVCKLPRLIEDDSLYTAKGVRVICGLF